MNARDAMAGRAGVIKIRTWAGDPLIPGTNFNDARAPGHGVAGVHHQVNQGVFQLADVKTP
jgi:hypothetical protein